jgi:UDP-2,3-diacylglucosamine hydrolase
MTATVLPNTASLPRVWPSLLAPPRWQVVDVISDLHLQASDTATFAAWQGYMASTPADAVFILGDLFEVWVGDDVLCGDQRPFADNFERHCQQVLAHAARRLSLYFMHGNRDFLLADDFAHGAGLTLLSDPTALTFDAHHWLLTHGDALCLGDVAYQQFRAKVRTTAWCNDFLAKPLTERQQMARQLRNQSESIKASGMVFADVDHTMACAWLNAAGASTLVHGHTTAAGAAPAHPALAQTHSPDQDWHTGIRATKCSI